MKNLAESEAQWVAPLPPYVASRRSVATNEPKTVIEIDGGTEEIGRNKNVYFYTRLTVTTVR